MDEYIDQDSDRNQPVSAPKILIVEDESSVREMVRFVLVREHFQTAEAETAEQALAQIAAFEPSLIVLDWMLPGIDGVDLVRQLRSGGDNRDIPIIMLTAKGEEHDKVKGLEAGVDDYISKPFSARELIARIRAVLRRVVPEKNDQKVEIRGLSLDPASHRVFADKKIVDLGPTEFRLLHFLMAHAERVYSRNQLLDGVWGTNVYIDERTVDVHIRRLRKALEVGGFDRLIQTVRGVGYRFSERR